MRNVSRLSLFAGLLFAAYAVGMAFLGAQGAAHSTTVTGR